MHFPKGCRSSWCREMPRYYRVVNNTRSSTSREKPERFSNPKNNESSLVSLIYFANFIIINSLQYWIILQLLLINGWFIITHWSIDWWLLHFCSLEWICGFMKVSISGKNCNKLSLIGHSSLCLVAILLKRHMMRVLFCGSLDKNGYNLTYCCRVHNEET